jgi:hypothetical protein
MTQTTQTKRSRDWDAENANVFISDGTNRSAARFSSTASNETIVREYLQGYGYCDPEELFGRWNEGWISRGDAESTAVNFYWRLTGERVKRGPSTGGASRYAYDLRFSRPFGELRADGYQY